MPGPNPSDPRGREPRDPRRRPQRPRDPQWRDPKEEPRAKPHPGHVFRVRGNGPTFRRAEYKPRLIAGLIDHGAAMVIWIVCAWTPWWFFLFVTLGLLGFQGWNQWTQGISGQSLGKSFTHIALVSQRDAQPLGANQAVFRWFFHLLDTLPLGLGYLFPLWDDKRQTFADMLAKSVVIDEQY